MKRRITKSDFTYASDFVTFFISNISDRKIFLYKYFDKLYEVDFSLKSYIISNKSIG